MKRTAEKQKAERIDLPASNLSPLPPGPPLYFNLLRLRARQKRVARSCGNPLPARAGGLSARISDRSYRASSPVSPVRILTASCKSATKTLPSPIWPVWAAFIIVSTTVW